MTTNSPAEPSHLVDLASVDLGGRVLFANDEFFAEAANLLKTTPAEWREGAFTDRGKWMDGWETRRRREPGHDFCLIALGARGSVREIVIETTHFRGNQPETFALHGVDVPGAAGDALPPPEAWGPVLEQTPLEANATHRFEVEETAPLTHVRLSIYPDGGVARLRVLGLARPDWGRLAAPLDLAALAHGGLPVAASDGTFGEPKNLLLPGPSTHMGQGWETRRRRGPGHDWVVVRLGRRGVIDGVRLETDHFKGNYPESASLERCDLGDAGDEAPSDSDWEPLVDRAPLKPDATHQWMIQDAARRVPSTHVRLNIFPDGGVARLRVFGRPLAGD